MIVVLIIGILLSIAIPGFLQARESSRAKSCVANLKQIDSAKQQWAMDTKATTTATPTSANLAPAYVRTIPACPSAGTYTLGNVATSPSCSIGTNTANTIWSHVLP